VSSIRTFGELLTEVEDRHKRTVGVTTYRGINSAYADLRRYLGGIALDELTEDHLDAFARAKQDGMGPDGKPGNKPLGPRAVNRRLQLAERALNEALRLGLIQGVNPAQHVPRPQVPRDERQVLSEAEMGRLVEACGEDVELRAMVRCLTELAMRLGEVLGLSVRGWDSEAKTVRIFQVAAVDSSVKPQRHFVRGYPKTSWSVRTLNPTDELAADLDSLAKERSDLFFPTSAGTLIQPSNFYRSKWRPLVVRAGFTEPDPDNPGEVRAKPGINPHLMRHSRATIIAATMTDAQAFKLSRFLGHSNPAFTLSKYASHWRGSTLSPDEYMGSS
jgi:integrase